MLAAAALAATGTASLKGQDTQPGRDPALLHRHVATLTADKEREQEFTLRRLLALGGPDDEQAEVLTRLANLLRARALQLGVSAQLAETDAPGQAASLREQLKSVRAESIARYRELLEKYPSSPRLDEALFFLADSLQEAGDERAAVVVARELITRFPKSGWAPDSHVFVGEHDFETAKLDQALAEYRAAAEVTTAEVYPYAVYKAAWCRFNQREFVDGMHLLRKVVEVSESRAGHKDDGQGSSSKVQLVREAGRDYVIFYLRAGKAEGAFAEFSSAFGEAPARRMLDNYARLLAKDGRDPEAQIVYERLLALHGEGTAQAALDRARLLEIEARSARRKELMSAASAYRASMEKAQAHAPADEASKEALEEAQRLGEEQLRMLAVNLHAQARKTQQEETYASARTLYTHYLALFPQAEAAYELRFFAAELHYELNDKALAAALYEAVVKQDLAAMQAKKKPGKRLVDAAWSAVLSRDEAMGGAQPNTGPKDQHAASLGDSALKPLEPGEKLLEAACSLYLQALPAGPKAVEVAYRLGRLEIRNQELDQATSHLSSIALQHPEHELAEFAANLVLDVQNLKKDFPAVHAWAVKLLGQSKLLAKRPSLKATLERVEEESAYSIAEGQKDDLAQAKALLAFVDAHKSGALFDKALFGASAALSRAGHIDEALAARARLSEEAANSPLLPRALLASAADHAVVGDFGEAAQLSERYAAGFRKQEDTRKWRREHPSKTKRPALSQDYDKEKARAALHDAAVLREARGELRLALADRQSALKLWPTGQDADDDNFAAAMLKAKLGEPSSAAKDLSSLAYAGGHGKAGLAIRAWRESARLFARVHQADKAQWAWSSLEHAYARLNEKQRAETDGAAEAAAEAHLALGQKAFDEFAQQQIKAPLQATLARKVALLKKVKKRDEETVAMRQAEPAVCALVQLGEAQLLLSSAIEHSPTPPGLRGEQRKLYRDAIAEQWKPIREGAGETLREAEQKARELGIGAGSCAEKARASLDKLGTPVQPARELQLPEVRPSAPGFVDADGSAVGSPHGSKLEKQLDAVHEQASGKSNGPQAAQMEAADAE